MKKSATAILIWLTIITAGTVAKSAPPDSAITASRDVKKVIITGNPIVYFIQGRKEEVVITDGDPEALSIKKAGYTLSIHSNTKIPVTVTVYFKDIYRIDAADHTIVRSVGKLAMENLQVILRDNADARIKADTQSLYTKIDDLAKLELLGTTEHHISSKEGNATVKTRNFIAKTTQQEQSGEVVARK